MPGPFARITLGLALIAAVVGLSACSKDPVGPVDTSRQGSGVPGLPSLSTMQMDLSFFGGDNVDIASLENGAPSSDLIRRNAGRLNFINAAVRVLFVQLVIYDALKAPIGAFAAAIHSIPQAQDDGWYLWTFIFVEDDVDYGIFLYGREAGDHTEWRMEVSANEADLALDHFVWFEGEAQKDHSGGYWQFYAPALEPATVGIGTAAATPGRPSIRIVWLHEPAGSELVITVNDEQSPDLGDVVSMFNSPAMGYVEIYDASDDVTSNITWFANGTGSITVPDYNGGENACWDEQQRDTVCP